MTTPTDIDDNHMTFDDELKQLLKAVHDGTTTSLSSDVQAIHRLMEQHGYVQQEQQAILQPTPLQRVPVKGKVYKA